MSPLRLSPRPTGGSPLTCGAGAFSGYRVGVEHGLGHRAGGRSSLDFSLLGGQEAGKRQSASTNLIWAVKEQGVEGCKHTRAPLQHVLPFAPGWQPLGGCWVVPGRLHNVRHPAGPSRVKARSHTDTETQAPGGAWASFTRERRRPGARSAYHSVVISPHSSRKLTRGAVLDYQAGPG